MLAWNNNNLRRLQVRATGACVWLWCLSTHGITLMTCCDHMSPLHERPLVGMGTSHKRQNCSNPLLRTLCADVLHASDSTMIFGEAVRAGNTHRNNPSLVSHLGHKRQVSNHIPSVPCLREHSMLLLLLNSSKSNLSSSLEEELPASSQSQYLPLFAPHFLVPKLAPESFLCINSRHCVNTVLRFT